VYDYYQTTNEAHERMKRREKEAAAERNWRQARGRRQKRRRAQLARALAQLNQARRGSRLRAEA
jgi:carboxypeptidase C (cathepsin A)